MGFLTLIFDDLLDNYQSENKALEEISYGCLGIAAGLQVSLLLYIFLLKDWKNG